MGRRLTIVVELPDSTRGGPSFGVLAEEVGAGIIHAARVSGDFVSAQWGDMLPEEDEPDPDRLDISVPFAQTAVAAADYLAASTSDAPVRRRPPPDEVA